MPHLHIERLDDPRLAPYQSLKESNRTRWTGQFVAEGEKLVRRLLESDFTVASVLIDQRHYQRLLPLLPPDLDVFVVPNRAVSQIIGFNFHRGVLACGLRKPAAPIDRWSVERDQPAMLVVCPDVQDPENLGSIVRIACAFGADGIVLGGQCADPFSRRVLRVSMGAVFRLPILTSVSLIDDLLRLRQEGQFQLAAAVLADDAEPLWQTRRPARLALLLGNEGQGLDPAEVAICDRRVTIPMQPGTDSLNVAVAAGIFLYHLMRPENFDSAEASGTMPWS